MLYGLLVTLFFFLCLFMILIILWQQSKSSMGLGSMGGSNQMLFGSSGGTDILQKTTWICGALFIFLSLVLSIMKSNNATQTRYAQAPATKIVTPQAEKVEAPTSTPAPVTSEAQEVPAEAVAQ